MTFECAYCRATFADLGLFCDHVARHGVRQCQRPERPVWREANAERVRVWRVQQMAEDAAASRAGEAARMRAYRERTG